MDLGRKVVDYDPSDVSQKLDTAYVSSFVKGIFLFIFIYDSLVHVPHDQSMYMWCNREGKCISIL